MANGYTCCIDFERLRGSLETLSSIDSCLKTVDLPGFFIEIETELKNVNFEHGNCIPYYKGEIDSALYEYDKVKKKIDNLITSVTKTVNEFEDKDHLSYRDLQDISTQYGERSKLTTNENIEIKVCNDSLTFERDMDSSIRDFMIHTKSIDYPQEFSSYNEWKEFLIKKYDNNLPSQEINDYVEKEIAVWQQEQTGSSVANVATSTAAEQQSNINSLTNIYKEKYRLSDENAKALAIQQEKYDSLKNSATTSIEQIKQAKTQLDKLKEDLGVSLRKISPSDLMNDMNGTQNNQTITTIPAPEQPQQEVVQYNEINTVPIGLGIAASGIAGSIGAVVVSEIKDKRNTNNLESYYEPPEEVIEEKYENNINPYPAPVIEEVSPYHASRDRESISKFYDDEDDFYEEEN